MGFGEYGYAEDFGESEMNPLCVPLNQRNGEKEKCGRKMNYSSCARRKVLESGLKFKKKKEEEEEM